jgi:hypothetical protein
MLEMFPLIFDHFYFFFNFKIFLFFETGAHCVAKVGLELTAPPASASRVLGLQACTIILSTLQHFLLTALKTKQTRF